MDETYNSIKCTGMVWASSKAGPAGMGRALCVDPEAASDKPQASSLTRLNYRTIKDYAKKEKNKTKTNN